MTDTPRPPDDVDDIPADTPKGEPYEGEVVRQYLPVSVRYKWPVPDSPLYIGKDAREPIESVVSIEVSIRRGSIADTSEYIPLTGTKLPYGTTVNKLVFEIYLSFITRDGICLEVNFSDDVAITDFFHGADIGPHFDPDSLTTLKAAERIAQEIIGFLGQGLLPNGRSINDQVLLEKASARLYQEEIYPGEIDDYEAEQAANDVRAALEEEGFLSDMPDDEGPGDDEKNI